METMMTISLVIFTTIIFLIGVITGGLCVFKLGKKLGKELPKEWNKIKEEQTAFDEAWNKRVNVKKEKKL